MVTPWLEEMPYRLPLIASVPVRADDGTRGIVFSVDEDEVVIASTERSLAYEEVVIDLEHRQGFGFALHLAVCDYDGRSPFSYNGPIDLEVIWRHLRGETTKSDRAALAKTLRSLQGS